jgi:site-specific DNA recombinase
MPTAAIYARVSSTRQRQEQTIQSQTAALLVHAEQQGLDVPPQWVFEDEGYSGATLVRPALERLRDLVYQVPVEVVLCYAPDRLARRYAYQALLIEELARAGTEVCFLNGPVGDRPEDALLVQFQGMIAEYEKAQIIERTRRGKAHRARAGVVNVLSGAPYGYRYVRKSDHAEARYEVCEPEASVVRELFGRYVEEYASIADLARWLTEQQIPTRTGKARWDRSTVWGMLRNPAYAGRAAFAKTMRTQQRARLTRPARLAGRSSSRNPLILDRPAEDWVQIPVPQIISEETFQLAARRLEDNQRFAARNTKVPSLLQGLAACQACGYAYYRTSTRTATRRLYYYRCLGSDDYRYPGGRRCANLPVRADYLDQVIWDHVTALLADPTLIRAELDRRLAELHAANPARATKARLQREQTRTTTAISRLVEAYQEQLLSLEELRARTPALRAKEQTLRAQLDALDAQLVDQAAYLKLAETLESFLGRLRDKADTASVTERQRVLRLIIREVLIGPERVVVRHRIPVTSPNPAPGYLLRGRSHHPALRRPGDAVSQRPSLHHPGAQHAAHQVQDRSVADAFPDRLHQPGVRNRLKADTRRAGSGRYRRSLSSAANSSRSRSIPYSSVSASVVWSMPAAPRLRRTCSHALSNTSLRQTLSNSAWNRLVGSALAARYSACCKARTLSPSTAARVDLALRHSPSPSFAHARERSSGPSSPQVVLSCGSTGTTTASDSLPARSSTSRLHTGYRTTLSAPVRSALGPGRASPVPAATL